LNNQSEFVGVSFLDNGEFHWLDSLSYSNVPLLQSLGRSQDGVGPWINFVTSTPNVSNEIVEVAELGMSRMALYPNPTRDILNFNQTKDLTIFDISGREVVVTKDVKTVDVSFLSSGLYFIKLDNQTLLFEKVD
jgi:hypothetical protein